MGHLRQSASGASDGEPCRSYTMWEGAIHPLSVGLDYQAVIQRAADRGALARGDQRAFHANGVQPGFVYER